ncbi:MAG: GNAT family N-acetyltransferase [Pseudomonadota bacterium]
MRRLFAPFKESIKILVKSTCDEFSFSRINIIDLTSLLPPKCAKVREVTACDPATSHFAAISGRSDKNCSQATLYGIWESDRLACYVACHPANAYRDIALPERLKSHDVLVNRFLVAPELRDRNLGSSLLDSVFRILFQRGFTRAYAVVWHNSWPSIRAFHKAGATLIHSIVVIRFRFWRQSFHFRFSMKGLKLRRALAVPVPIVRALQP